jgi:hypothetical protein
MYMGSEDGAPGLTLYEIDPQGWVHRQVQIHAHGSRFSPEDILMRRPVNTDYMALHPAAEEIGQDDFEMLWLEVQDSRSFRRRLPDPNTAWEGVLEVDGVYRELRWMPRGTPGKGWIVVPGFVNLFVRGTESESWATQSDLFLEKAIQWRYIQQLAA